MNKLNMIKAGAVIAVLGSLSAVALASPQISPSLYFYVNYQTANTFQKPVYYTYTTNVRIAHTPDGTLTTLLGPNNQVVQLSAQNPDSTSTPFVVTSAGGAVIQGQLSFQYKVQLGSFSATSPTYPLFVQNGLVEPSRVYTWKVNPYMACDAFMTGSNNQPANALVISCTQVPSVKK